MLCYNLGQPVQVTGEPEVAMIAEPRTAKTLSIKAAAGIIRQAGLHEDDLANHLGISSKTYSRRMMRGTLEPAESMQVEMIERSLHLATELLGDTDRARTYLHTPLVALENRSPLQLLTSIAGYERVRDSLYAQAYGMF
jgi:putative toxin-antitoxin system antitoxin component (TIGR02293 family)